MPKMKTKSGAKKRFKITGSGQVKRPSANRRHILTKKSAKRKRQLRKSVYVNASDMRNMRGMLPYGGAH